MLGALLYTRARAVPAHSRARVLKIPPSPHENFQFFGYHCLFVFRSDYEGRSK